MTQTEMPFMKEKISRAECLEQIAIQAKIFKGASPVLDHLLAHLDELDRAPSSEDVQTLNLEGRWQTFDAPVRPVVAFVPHRGYKGLEALVGKLCRIGGIIK